MQALGSPECERMLHGVAAVLGVRRTSIWYDDILQAARVRIWRAQGRHVAASTVAHRAMIDELARCGVDRDRYARGHRLVSLDDLDLSEPVCEMPGPEAVAHAADVLRQLDAQHPGWVEAIVLSGGLRQAGQRMGRSEAWASLMCAKLTAAALQMAARRAPIDDCGESPQACQPASPRRPARWQQRNAARAAECRRVAYHDAVAPADQIALLLLADCGGCYKTAAAALQWQPRAMRAVVMRARRAV